VDGPSHGSAEESKKAVRCFHINGEVAERACQRSSILARCLEVVDAGRAHMQFRCAVRDCGRMLQTIVDVTERLSVYGGRWSRIAHTSSGEGDRMAMRKNLIARILKQSSREVFHTLQHIDRQSDST